MSALNAILLGPATPAERDRTLASLVAQVARGAMRVWCASDPSEAPHAKAWQAHAASARDLGLNDGCEICFDPEGQGTGDWADLARAARVLAPDPDAPVIVLRGGDEVLPGALETIGERFGRDDVRSLYAPHDPDRHQERADAVWLPAAALAAGICDGVLAPAPALSRLVFRGDTLAAIVDEPGGLGAMRHAWNWAFARAVAVRTGPVALDTPIVRSGGTVWAADDATLTEIEADTPLEDRLEALIGLIGADGFVSVADDTAPEHRIPAAAALAQAIRGVQEAPPLLEDDQRRTVLKRLRALHEAYAVTDHAPLSKAQLAELEAHTQYTELTRTIAEVHALTEPLDALANACRRIVYSHDRLAQSPSALPITGNASFLLERYRLLSSGTFRKLAEATDLDQLDWKREFRRRPLDLGHWRAIRRYKRRTRSS